MSLGISPQYALDEMSFDEIAALLKADNEKQKRELELARRGWFYTVVAQTGTDKFSTPEDLVQFEWEKKPKKQGKKMSRGEREVKAGKAKNYLRHGRK